MNYIDILGYTGGFFLTINMIPQIIKTYKDKKTENISFVFLLLNLVGLKCNMIYSYIKGIYAISIPITISLLCTCIMLYFKYIYRNNKILP